MNGSMLAGKKQCMLRKGSALTRYQRPNNRSKVGKVNWNYGSELDYG